MGSLRPVMAEGDDFATPPRPTARRPVAPFGGQAVTAGPPPCR